MEPIVVEKVMDGAIRQGWTLTLEFSLNGFGCFPWLFVHPPHYSSDQPVVTCLLAATSWEAGYRPMDLILFNNECSSRHRNIKLLGDGLSVFPFKMVWGWCVFGSAAGGDVGSCHLSTLACTLFGHFTGTHRDIVCNTIT